jgi:hypothetical protein
MGSVEFFRQPLTIDLEHRQQIKTEKEQIHKIFVADLLAIQVGMHQPQAAQSPAGGPLPTKPGDHDPGMIADNHRLDPTGTVDQYGQLTIYLKGEAAEGTGHFRADDLPASNPFVAKPFKGLELVGFQAGSVAADYSDGASSSGEEKRVSGSCSC